MICLLELFKILLWRLINSKMIMNSCLLISRPENQGGFPQTKAEAEKIKR